MPISEVPSQCPHQRFAARHGLPKLTGTTPQIRWAEAIRHRLIDGVRRRIKTCMAYELRELQQTLEFISSQSEASWWIENRNKKSSTIKHTRNIAILKAYGAVFGYQRPKFGRGK